MARDASPLILSFKSFDRLWKTLVSRRKARKLNVDRDLVWQQLAQSGENADFLRANVEAKDTERGKVRANRVAKNLLRETPRAGAAPEAEAVASKSAKAIVTASGKSASRKIAAKRGAQNRPATAARTSRRNRVGARK